MSSAEAPETGTGTPEFQKVLRGWDPGEVRAYLERVTSQVRDLELRIQTLEAELEQAKRDRDRAQTLPSDPYAAVSRHVADLLRHLDQHVASVQATAETDAARIRSEAEVLRSSTLEDLRAIRDHMASSLKHLDAAFAEAAPGVDKVVSIPDVRAEARAAGSTTERTATRPVAPM